jgi:2-iminobutanoate/2-iminopropanoate deaminase
MIDRIYTNNAPSNNKPYSQGVHADGRLYVSGYGPVDPETGEMEDEDIGAQAELTLQNIAGVVEEAGGSLDDVVKVTVYLTDLDDYDKVNESYGTIFASNPPARVCVEVSRLPGEVSIEMDAIAHID